MFHETAGPVAEQGIPCRYGVSKLMYRGPRRQLDGEFVAFLGGIETFGKFVRQPYPHLVEAELGVDCVNLGVANAGLDAILSDPEMIRIAVMGDYRVLQLPSAHMLSNRLYRVHPRRNDRFLSASTMLRTIYREVDFTEFTFVKHLLGALREVSPERFEVVTAELRQAWIARMRQLLTRLGPRTLLLWLKFHGAQSGDGPRFGGEPLFVTQDMIDTIRDAADGVLRIPVRMARDTDEIDDMQFQPEQQPVAGCLIGPTTHRDVAETLLPHLRAAI